MEVGCFSLCPGGFMIQCPNGQIACPACCEKPVAKECPSCSQPIAPHFRCSAVETIVESLLVSCQYAHQGCNSDMLKFYKKEEHEQELCKYRSTVCPLWECKETFPMLSTAIHFASPYHRVQTVQLESSTKTVHLTMAMPAKDWSRVCLGGIKSRFTWW